MGRHVVFRIYNASTQLPTLATKVNYSCLFQTASTVTLRVSNTHRARQLATLDVVVHSIRVLRRERKVRGRRISARERYSPRCKPRDPVDERGKQDVNEQGERGKN